MQNLILCFAVFVIGSMSLRDIQGRCTLAVLLTFLSKVALVAAEVAQLLQDHARLAIQAAGKKWQTSWREFEVQ